MKSMENSKFYKILLGLGILILILVSVYFALPGPDQKSSLNGKINIPAQNGQIQTNDFHKTQVEQVAETSVLARTAGFEIVNYAVDNSFTITLSQKPLDKSRDEAEQKLLQILGVIPTEACKLKVAVFVPFSVDEKAAGIDYGLSFCPKGLPID